MKPWLVATLVWAVLSSCAAPPLPTRFRVAVDATRPPLAFLDGQKRLVGFEIDLWRATAEAEDWTLEFVQVPEVGLIRGVESLSIRGGLERGDWDAVSGTRGSNRLREFWALSEPYLAAGVVLVTRPQTPATLSRDWTGLLGTLVTGEGSQWINLNGLPRFLLRPYRDTESALEDLAEGRLRGVLADRVTVAAVRADNERLGLLVSASPPLDDDQPLVAALRKDDPRLERLNARWATFKSEGRLEALERRWFLR